MGFFIPTHALSNLKNYKYSSEDHSLLSQKVLKPFWRKFAVIFPSCMAPNLVTLSGLLFIVINVITTIIVDPTLNKESPSWVYYSYAIGFFLYQTFDACDGIHARKTGQSGPLGELFDHCCDSLNTTLSILPVCSMMGMGYGNLLILTQFGCLCNFYLSTWEEYHTHTLFLSEFSGPVEGIILLCSLHILTGILGQTLIWKSTLFQLPFFGPITLTEIMCVFTTVGLLFNIISAKNNVIKYYKSNNKEEKEKEKTVNNPITSALKGLLPFFLFYIPIFVLTLIEPNFINLPFILSIGLTIAFVVGRIIVNHLTQQPFPMVNPPMFLPISQLICYLFATYFLTDSQSTTTLALSWLGLGFSLGVHALFINEVIYEFTTYLDMYALTIKHPKKD